MVSPRNALTSAGAVLVAVALTVVAPSPAGAAPPTGYVDNFDGTSLRGGWVAYDSRGNGGNGLRRPSQIRVAGGIMTQTGTAGALSAGMVLDGRGLRYGRWEVRARMTTTGTGIAYHPVLALIPDGDTPYHCGATDVDFAESDLGGPTYFFAHNLPNRQDYLSRQIDQSVWHVYAVEITPRYVAWLIDGQVLMVDTNPAILSGVRYAVNVQLDANVSGGLKPARLQVDYVTITPWDGHQTIPAGLAPERGTYNGAC